MESLKVVFSTIELAAVVGVVGWLARSIILHLLSKDVEKFKSSLQIESQLELANLKASLESKAFEHQVRFSRLHERRAEIVGQLFAKIVALNKASSDFVRWFQNAGEIEKKDRLKNLWKTVDDFSVYFEKHSIYFEREVCEIILSFKDKLSIACTMLVSFVQEREAVELNYDQIYIEWDKAMKMMEQEVPVIKDALADSFRELLGVSQPKTITTP